MNPLVWMLLFATGFAITEMAVTHAVAKKLGNNGIVDVVWSAGFGGIVVLYALLAPPLTDGTQFDFRRCLLLAMVLGWSLRLGLHLYARVKKHHPQEDVRYAQLRKEWGENVDRRMFGFFQLQGAIQVVLSIPWLLSFLKNVPTRHPGALSPWEICGTALWILALVGESVADRQLASFRADPANRGSVCERGLWNYSRHPNYFFEWLVWVAFFLFTCGSPYGWLSLVAPVLMWHFLVNVTGIPMTEELSVRSKGDGYRAYQRTTSAFVPWFKRVSPQP